MTDDIAELTRRLNAFRDAREWGRFHTLKNLLVSLSLEASEALELVQWLADAEVEARLSEPEFRTQLQQECADVFLYLLMVCDRAGIDLVPAAHAKIDLNHGKYPAEKARGNAQKYSKLGDT